METHIESVPGSDTWHPSLLLPISDLSLSSAWGWQPPKDLGGPDRAPRPVLVHSGHYNNTLWTGEVGLNQRNSLLTVLEAGSPRQSARGVECMGKPSVWQSATSLCVPTCGRSQGAFWGLWYKGRSNVLSPPWPLLWPDWLDARHSSLQTQTSISLPLGSGPGNRPGLCILPALLSILGWSEGFGTQTWPLAGYWRPWLLDVIIIWTGSLAPSFLIPLSPDLSAVTQGACNFMPSSFGLHPLSWPQGSHARPGSGKPLCQRREFRSKDPLVHTQEDPPFPFSPESPSSAGRDQPGIWIKLSIRCCSLSCLVRTWVIWACVSLLWGISRIWSRSCRFRTGHPTPQPFSILLGASLKPKAFEHNPDILCHMCITP